MKIYIPESCAFLCRYLPDWLGVLLHRGRSGGCHAAVHLAVLFRGEEAEAVPVLKRASERRGQAETSGGAMKGRGLWLRGLTPVQHIRHQRHQVIMVLCTSWDTTHLTTAGTVS